MIRAAWLEGLRGILVAQLGDVDAGLRAQQESLQFLDQVPDYQGTTGLRGTVARCYLLRAELVEAQREIDAAQAGIALHQVRGVACTSVMLADAEAQVLRAELATGRDLKRALERARAACRRAVDHARFDNVGLPAAHRSAGQLEWLRGNLASACQHWQRSMDEASVWVRGMRWA